MAIEYFRSSLLAQEMEETWTGTVRFNAEQELSESQKAQARENIGAVPFGSNLKILGHFDTVAELQASAPQNVGDAYSVGATTPYNLYIFDGLRSEWLNYGQIRAADISAQYVENQVIAVSAWTQDTSSLAGYSYKAQITVSGATGDDFPIVAFNQSDAVSGNFAPLSFSFDGYLEIWAKEKPTAAVTIPIATIIVNGGNGRGITNATGGITAGSIGTENLVDGSVTARKIADECKNIIKENVALTAVAFNEDDTVDGASYKAELAVTGSTAAMLPLIAWTAAQSEELEVKRIESAAGKVVIYSANAPSADLTIPTVALISPIGTGSSGASGGSGGGITGTNGVTFTPHLSADGTLSWTNDGGLTNPVPVNIKGAKGDTGAQGAKGDKGDKGDTGAAGSDASVTAANIRTALGYTPANSANIPTVPTTAINANTAARHVHSNKDVLDEITGVVTADKVNGPDHVTDLVQYDAFQLAAQAIIDKIPSIDKDKIVVALGYTPLRISDIAAETTETLPNYTNQLDAAGYQSDATLDMTGAAVSGTSFVSGFIPVKKGDVIRVKDPSASSFSTGLVFALYKADKATGNNIGRYINTMQSNAAYGAVSISGNVLTWDTSNVGYYFWSDFAYLRVTTNSANSIVTVNEEISETSQVIKTLKSEFRVGKNNLNFNPSSSLLSGRKVVVFGDSIIGMTRDQTSVPAYAAAYTGAKVYNAGFGGCRMSVHPSSGYAAFSMWALAEAVAAGTWTTQDAQASSGQDYFTEQLSTLKGIDFSSVDVVVIHYGTNDFAANVTIDDTTDDAKTTTVCGALRYSIRKLLTAYPKLKIYISLPLYRMWDGVGAETHTNSLGKKLSEYNAAIEAVAAEFNLPVIDGYGRLGINALNDSAYSTDGTHLSDHGRRAFGELIGGNLLW